MSTPRHRSKGSHVARTALALGAALVLVGCGAEAPGTAGEPPPPSSSATSEAASPARLLTPGAFADVVGSGDRFVVNVHTPDEGSIAGTDAAIPFDELRARASELPSETTAPLAIYCRSGAMSEDASRTLADLGYTDVVDLRGGMNAWTASGRDLVPS